MSLLRRRISLLRPRRIVSLLRPRRIVSLLALTVVWCGLWRDGSVATIVAGLGVAAAVMAVGVGTPGTGGIRLRPLLELVGVITADLVRSTINVAAEIITPADSTAESIIAVEVPAQSRDHFLILVLAITLTPGTAVVDTDPDRGILYLHLLHDQGRQATIDHVHKLARLACEALPVSRTESTV